LDVAFGAIAARFAMSVGTFTTGTCLAELARLLSIDEKQTGKFYKQTLLKARVSV
jgi:hypothetical protein